MTTPVRRMTTRVEGSDSGMRRSACCSSCHSIASGVKASAGPQNRASTTRVSQPGRCQSRTGGIFRSAQPIVAPIAYPVSVPSAVSRSRNMSACGSSEGVRAEA